MPTPWDAMRAMLARRRAEAAEAAGRWQAAYDGFAEAGELWQDADPILAGSLWSRAGRQMSMLENRPAQLDASRRALALLPPWPRWDTPLVRDDGLLAQALLADALYWLDRIAEAGAAAREAVAAAEALGGPLELGRAYGVLAQALLRQGRPVETAGVMHRCVQIARAGAPPEILAAALTDHAVALGGLEQYAAARLQLDEALAVIDTIADPAWADKVRIGTLAAAASVRRAVGDADGAVGLAQRAAALCRRYGRREQYLQARMALGLALADNGELERASGRSGPSTASTSSAAPATSPGGPPTASPRSTRARAGCHGRRPGRGGRCGCRTPATSTPAAPRG
ncbi:hypothetical protein [Dactylosporangium darangshiense]|uniref:LuxR family transcriptional regulator n=1 Tax=Dactylosporangium darangshiense TaxID=579108 RepID=A0ABP8DBN0_9ACTN